jgi:hypothetical protein
MYLRHSDGMFSNVNLEEAIGAEAINVDVDE